MCNGLAKQVRAGVAQCNTKSRNLLRNVETGLEILFLVCNLSGILVLTLAVMKSHNGQRWARFFHLRPWLHGELKPGKPG